MTDGEARCCCCPSTRLYMALVLYPMQQSGARHRRYYCRPCWTLLQLELDGLVDLDERAGRSPGNVKHCGMRP